MRNQTSEVRRDSFEQAFPRTTGAPYVEYASAGMCGKAEMAAKEQAYLQSQAAQNACREPKPSREIPEKLRDLFEGTEVLSVRLATLERRLATALVQVPEELQKSGPLGYTTEMGDMLAQLIGRIHTCIQRLDSIDARLEL